MAPDLNSVPASPRPIPRSSQPASTASSRRASQMMAPPPLPLTSPTTASPSSVQPTTATYMPGLGSPGVGGIMASVPVGDNTGVGAGPGPMRHPRPLTAADLHLQLEK